MQQAGFTITRVIEIFSKNKIENTVKKNQRCRYCHSPYLSKILKYRPKRYYVDSFDFGRFKFFCTTCLKINTH